MDNLDINSKKHLFGRLGAYLDEADKTDIKLKKDSQTYQQSHSHYKASGTNPTEFDLGKSQKSSSGNVVGGSLLPKCYD